MHAREPAEASSSAAPSSQAPAQQTGAQSKNEETVPAKGKPKADKAEKKADKVKAE